MKIAYALLLATFMSGRLASQTSDANEYDVYVEALGARESLRRISKATNSPQNLQAFEAPQIITLCQNDPSIDSTPYHPGYEGSISHHQLTQTPMPECNVYSFTSYVQSLSIPDLAAISFDRFPYLAYPKGIARKELSKIAFDTSFRLKNFSTDKPLPHGPISLKEPVTHSTSHVSLFPDHVTYIEAFQAPPLSIDPIDCPIALAEIGCVIGQKPQIRRVDRSHIADLSRGIPKLVPDTELLIPTAVIQPCKPALLTTYPILLHVSHQFKDASYITHSLICEDELKSLLYSPSIYRIFAPKHISFAASKVHMPIRALPLAVADQDVKSCTRPSTQFTGVEFHKHCRQPKALILQPLPLTIQLPTLSEDQFVLDTEPLCLERESVTLGMQKPSCRYFPSFTRFEADEKRSKPFLNPRKTSSHQHYPRSVQDVYPEWLHHETFIPSLILGNHVFAAPTFDFDAVPDLRSLMKNVAPLHVAAAGLTRSFCSQLLPPVEANDPLTASSMPPNVTHGHQPVPESFRAHVFTKMSDLPLGFKEEHAFQTPSFFLDQLEALEELIQSTPVLHQSSHYSLKGQVHAALIDGGKQRKATRKRLKQDKALVPYGEFPEYEPTVLSIAAICHLPGLSLDPLPSALPYLWTNLECPDDIMATVHFMLKQHASKSHSVNRGHRVTAANLACIPSLRDLHTASLNHEFSTEVSWAPQAKGERYVFSLKLKPLDPTYFERIPQNIHFVLDNTNPITKNKLDAYKSAIMRSLPYVHAEDRFNIYSFSDELSAMSNVPLPSNNSSKQTTRNFLSRLKLYRAYNDANSYKLLVQLSDHLQSFPGMHTVLLFTDGSSLADMPHKFKYAQQLMNVSRMNVYPVCVAGDNDLLNLQILAKLQRGSVFHSPNFASFPRKFAAFIKKHQNPIVSDLHAVVTPIDPTAKMRLFNESPRIAPLYSGREIVLHGEMDKLCDFNLMLQGKFGSKWVNVNKTLSLGVQSSMDIGLHETVRHEAAAAYVNDYLVNENNQSLHNANKLLYR